MCDTKIPLQVCPTRDPFNVSVKKLILERIGEFRIIIGFIVPSGIFLPSILHRPSPTKCWYTIVCGWERKERKKKWEGLNFAVRMLTPPIPFVWEFLVTLTRERLVSLEFRRDETLVHCLSLSYSLDVDETTGLQRSLQWITGLVRDLIS